METRLLTYKEASEVLSISEESLYLLLRREKDPVPVVYLGKQSPRIDLAELKAWWSRQPKTLEGIKEILDK